MTNPKDPAFPEWQSIDSAPRDGTKILGYHKEDFQYVCWYELDGFVMQGDDDNLCFWPSHWMPLPPPPKEEG